MADVFPPIEPYEYGMLDVGDGQRIHYEICGNPDGIPALMLHGGPGSGCTPGMRRFFDPRRYRAVLFDQRNCGRSTPHASDPAVDLRHNTTAHLIADIERLRVHLGVERWTILGGSWGVTLGLAYAQRYPERVAAMVLFSITVSRFADYHWLYHEAGRYFPEEWERFRAASGTDGRDLIAAYHRLLNDPDAGVREAAARAWCDWEDAVVSTAPNRKPHPRYADAKFRQCFARIVTHYFVHHAWLGDGALLENAGTLAGIPSVLIHGRADLGSPVDTAYALHRAWPGSELVVIEEAGHELRTPGMRESIVAALDRFASSP